MNIIVAVDKNWAIGLKKKLLVSIPSDMKFFREMTTGKVVLMGRNTFESLPNGLPLTNRVNVVLTHDKEYEAKGAVVVHSTEEALDFLKDYETEDVFCIGGETVYKEFLPYCDTAHVTFMDESYQADAYFPNLDTDEEWALTMDSEENTYFDIVYTFRLYKKIK